MYIVTMAPQLTMTILIIIFIIVQVLAIYIVATRRELFLCVHVSMSSISSKEA